MGERVDSIGDSVGADVGERDGARVGAPVGWYVVGPAVGEVEGALVAMGQMFNCRGTPNFWTQKQLDPPL